MAVWRLTEFGGVALPIYNTTADFTGGRAESPLLNAVTGVHDPYSGLRVSPRRAVFTLQGVYAREVTGTPASEAQVWVTGDGDTLVTGGGDRLVFTQAVAAALTVTTARAQLEALRALRGRTGLLKRQALDDDTVVQEVTCRLLEVRHTTRREWHGQAVQIDLVFETTTDPFWRTPTLRTATGLSLSATVAGNAPVRDAILTVTGAIASSCTISGAGHNLTWTGTLSGGQTLVLQGLVAKANAIDTAVAWNSGHTKELLIELEPGANAITVTGAASAALTWYDKWQ